MHTLPLTPNYYPPIFSCSLFRRNRISIIALISSAICISARLALQNFSLSVPHRDKSNGCTLRKSRQFHHSIFIEYDTGRKWRRKAFVSSIVALYYLHLGLGSVGLMISCAFSIRLETFHEVCIANVALRWVGQELQGENVEANGRGR
ncbi:hypothetical protein K469DRAFT_392391 [Zopfia rhizophila CBS 207.26]|uniref:Uncharacterized protein n=1 Tax=Zopfia rhizophila CBS 207.26 TaxID=1314779 RepID=A0A6A6EJ63_9PEZI|nr:hypothetical protein K469DRAFT_392391 [Zopfia rhizophila CBS 207.26]